MTLPNITVLIPFSGSNIDTSTIDGWRQGVEITLHKHFDAGIVKIRSGERGHRLAVLNYGRDRVSEFTKTNSHYTDVNNNNVVSSIIGKLPGTQPIIARETGNGTLNDTAGILEPFNKRRKIFEPIDGDGLPLIDLHDVRADTVIVTSVFEITDKINLPFQDGVNPKIKRNDAVSAHPSFEHEYQRLTGSNFSIDLDAALVRMKPEDWDYIAPNERTGNCGQPEDYYYSTNSISFIGLTY
jgi:hypothetical protein